MVIDACYAGGFRSLIDRPNVMGLFSSEEDLTSLVASRFKAGGFLSYFLRAGLTGEADDDGDRIVTAGELSTYVRRRFRREGDIPATDPRGRPQLPEMLVERGGVHVDDVVVRLRHRRRAAPCRRTRRRRSTSQTAPAAPSAEQADGRGRGSAKRARADPGRGRRKRDGLAMVVAQAPPPRHDSCGS